MPIDRGRERTGIPTEDWFASGSRSAPLVLLATHTHMHTLLVGLAGVSARTAGPPLPFTLGGGGPTVAAFPSSHPGGPYTHTYTHTNTHTWTKLHPLVWVLRNAHPRSHGHQHTRARMQA
eukprot:GHVU01113088.1.p6 GENE.GHVU01113088.1~~GHVU01113088.1.p6  ORF type:complete len:120 (-),score=3.48 GHVU01113088.1:2330-2689(-)